MDPNRIPEDLVAEQEVSSQPTYTAEACKFNNLNQISLKLFNPNYKSKLKATQTSKFTHFYLNWLSTL